MKKEIIVEKIGKIEYKYFIINGVKTFKTGFIAKCYAMDKGIKSYETSYDYRLFEGLEENIEEEKNIKIRTRGYAPRMEPISYLNGVEDIDSIDDIFEGYLEGLVVTRKNKKIDKYHKKDGVWVKEQQVCLINSKTGKKSVWNISDLNGISIKDGRYNFINENSVYFIMYTSQTGEVELYTKDWDSNSWYIITKEEEFKPKNCVVFEYEDRTCNQLYNGWLITEDEAFDEESNINKYPSIYEVHRLKNEQQAFKYMFDVLKEFNNEKLTSFFYK